MQTDQGLDRNAVPTGQSMSVIVTTFDDPWSLSCVLHAIAAQTLLPREVIVADDGSDMATSDALNAIAAQVPFALLHVRQSHNGFRAARSRNNAIAAASSESMAFLDQDTMPHPDWLARHAAALKPGYACLGASLNLEPERKQDLTPENIRAGDFIRWHTPADNRRLLRFHMKSRLYSIARTIGFPFLNRPTLRSGNFAISRIDIVRVNGFDESFVGWGQEDDNLGRRLYLAGVKPIVLTRLARVTHIPHPRRNRSRESGDNLSKHKGCLTDIRSANGLDSRPYPDVVLRRVGTGQTQ